MLKNIVNQHKEKLQKVAEKNTVRNENGKIVAAKNDPWRDDESEMDIVAGSLLEEQGVLV